MLLLVLLLPVPLPVLLLIPSWVTGSPPARRHSAVLRLGHGRMLLHLSGVRELAVWQGRCGMGPGRAILLQRPGALKGGAQARI